MLAAIHTMCRPNRDQRPQTQVRQLMRKPNPDSDSSSIILYTELDATFGTLRRLGSVHEIEDVRDSAHERHRTRPGCQVADVAFDVVGDGLPLLGWSRLERIADLFFCEAVACFSRACATLKTGARDLFLRRSFRCGWEVCLDRGAVLHWSLWHLSGLSGAIVRIARCMRDVKEKREEKKEILR